MTIAIMIGFRYCFLFLLHNMTFQVADQKWQTFGQVVVAVLLDKFFESKSNLKAAEIERNIDHRSHPLDMWVCLHDEVWFCRSWCKVFDPFSFRFHMGQTSLHASPRLTFSSNLRVARVLDEVTRNFEDQTDLDKDLDEIFKIMDVNAVNAAGNARHGL